MQKTVETCGGEETNTRDIEAVHTRNKTNTKTNISIHIKSPFKQCLLPNLVVPNSSPVHTHVSGKCRLGGCCTAACPPAMANWPGAPTGAGSASSAPIRPGATADSPNAGENTTLSGTAQNGEQI